MKKSKIEKRLPEPQYKKEQKAEGNSVRPAIAKPRVVRSPKSVGEPVTKLADFPKFNDNEFNKRMRSYNDLFKMWGLDNS